MGGVLRRRRAQPGLRVRRGAYARADSAGAAAVEERLVCCPLITMQIAGRFRRLMTCHCLRFSRGEYRRSSVGRDSPRGTRRMTEKGFARGKKITPCSSSRNGGNTTSDVAAALTRARYARLPSPWTEAVDFLDLEARASKKVEHWRAWLCGKERKSTASGQGEGSWMTGERIRKERARASDAPETIHAVNRGAAEERSGFGVEFQEFERHFGGADHVVDVEPFAHGVNIAHPGAEIRDCEAAVIEDVGVASAARRFGLDCAAGAARGFDDLAHQRRVLGDVHTLVGRKHGVVERGLDTFAVERDGGARDRVLETGDHVIDLRFELVGIARAAFAADRYLVGNDVACAAALDSAEVGGGFGVDASEAHRSDRLTGNLDRGDAALRCDSGVRLVALDGEAHRACDGRAQDEIAGRIAVVDETLARFEHREVEIARALEADF